MLDNLTFYTIAGTLLGSLCHVTLIFRAFYLACTARSTHRWSSVRPLPRPCNLIGCMTGAQTRPARLKHPGQLV